MRPLDKWAVGTNDVSATYNPHTGAKKYLLSNFGKEPFYYCCYCERAIPGVNLEVEHIKPEGLPKYYAIKYDWDNFLIACKNCNLAKLKEDFEYADVLMPHIQNTFAKFSFRDTGTVTSDDPDAATRRRAMNTIRLVGLDRGRTHIRRTPQDDRYEVRSHFVKEAKRKLGQYESGKQDVTDIVELARTNGFWSIWMSAFHEHEEVLDALIENFQGTFVNCRTTDVNRL